MKKGFTLIELLVVVSIISLLSSIVLTSVNNAKARGRDARRKEDFKQMQNALELYYNQNGGYPALGAPNPLQLTYNVRSNPAGSGTLLAAYYAFFAPLITQGFISTIPIDPINVASGATPYSSSTTVNSIYYFFSNGTAGGSNATVYLLCSWLENQSDKQTLQYTDVIDPFTGSYLYGNEGYSAYMYCVRNPS
jgi:prepilin-type N-terminal cleavage/methylation domain-containing protein